MKATTRQWLDFAQTELRSCENNLHDEFVTNIVAFHAHQAVEKVFKAMIEEKELAPPRVHNLIHLHSYIEQYLNVPVNLGHLEELDSVYTSSRYPVDIGILSNGKPTLTEAKELYENAKKIFEIILQAID
jgi:HEPN domain-containing protein